LEDDHGAKDIEAFFQQLQSNIDEALQKLQLEPDDEPVPGPVSGSGDGELHQETALATTMSNLSLEKGLQKDS